MNKSAVIYTFWLVSKKEIKKLINEYYINSCTKFTAKSGQKRATNGCFT
jgi:hypothetical protein